MGSMRVVYNMFGIFMFFSSQTKGACAFTSRVKLCSRPIINQQKDVGIDWDADLFSQINRDIHHIEEPDKALKMRAVNEWDMPRPSDSDIKSMRQQMKQSWGNNDGKPTADWVPGAWVW